MTYFVRAAFGAAAFLFLFLASSLQAADTDPNTVWPLCGRITESPPPDWVDSDGCPLDRAGDPAYSDEPLSSTFGPRPLASESNRYDFHRGVDIATPIGTPFFAITDGIVEIAGVDPGYSDPLVKLRHFRPGETSCNAGGCYHSQYLHIGSWVVSENDSVVKGQLLGYTGESASGFDHVHFEVRDAPDFDVFSAWSRDAIHPLAVVPYAAPNNTTITFNSVDFTNPSAGIVDLTVVSNRFDLVEVDIDLFDAGQQAIPQPGDTPDANGYLVEPSSFDMEKWNFDYTHKDSTAFSWESFGAGGANECPYHGDHGASYDAGVHMDREYPGNPLEGEFNGVHIRTLKYWPSDVDDYEVDVEFQALQGSPSCVQATATFASGDTEVAEWGSCGAVSPAQILRGPYLQMHRDDGVTIKWRTDVATDSVVRYGTSPGNLNLTGTVAGSRSNHEVSLSGLGASQQFWYSVGDSISAIAGDSTYHFRTAPPQGDSADTRIWVIGDSGTANQDARNVRDAFKAYTASGPADLWLMLGDNAYNDGTDAEYQAAVFDTYPEILRQLPLWSTLGNHDGHSADSGTQTGPYYDIFTLPTNGEAGGLSSGTEAYYSFDYANIHFICLDSYDTSRSPTGAMMTWLESDLATNTQPWVIAFWHHPPYTKGSHNSDTEGQLIDMRQNALPILEAWGVDLVLSGHSHSYERSYLLDSHYGVSTSLDPDTHVLDPGDGWELGDGVYQKPDVIAAENAGAVYSVAGSSGKISGGSLNHPAMFLSLNTLGSLVIDVAGNRMDVVFIDDAAAMQDIFSIEKTPDTAPPLLTAATAQDATLVLVNFSEGLEPATASDPSNYAIAGLTINDAALQPDGRSVRLTTSAMTPETHYTLIVNNVRDASGNTIAPDSQISFDFLEFVTVTFQDGLLPEPGYFGTQDGYIREASPNTRHGTETSLQVDGAEPSGQTTDMNMVIQWDTDSIPTGATVEDAHIELEVSNVSGGPYECYALLKGWDEDEVTWNEALSGVAWGTAGALSASDRGAEVVCSVNATSTGPLTVNFNNDGLALLQTWLDTPSANHGIIIANPTNSNGADFHASESATAMARPKLVVTYRLQSTPSNEDPVAGFVPSCTDLDCGFTDTSNDSDGTVVSWNWNFGDGNNSSAQNPNHSYAVAGDYTVSLTVTDDDGATGNTSTLVSVTAPDGSVTVSFQEGLLPDAGYSGTDDGYIRQASPGTRHGTETTLQVDGSEPQGQTTDMSIVIRWNTGSILTHAVVEDAHMVLAVTNVSSGPYECYALSTAWDQNEVTWNEASAGAPWASPGASSPSDRGSDVVCTVNATSTGPLTIEFDGDGLALIQSWIANPSSNHGIIIANPNTSDGADFHASESATASARPKLVVTYNEPDPPPNEDPVASFMHGCTDLDCGFTDTSTDADGTVVSWSWDFGDGNGSSAQSPNHSYAAAGDYTVSLTVTDDDGATGNTSTLVSVAAPNQSPTAGFTHSCTDLNCGFTDTSSDSDGTVDSWSWDFGDGNVSSAQGPNHSYAAAGDYTVSLTVTDDDGATDNTSTLVTVTASSGGPVAFENVSTTGGDQNTFNLTHNVSAGTNRLMVVFVACDSGDKNIGSVSSGGQALTQVLNFQHPGGKPRLAAYYQVSPPLGANGVTVALSGGNSDKCSVSAMSFSGANQASPISGVSSNSGSNRSPGMVIGSVSGDMVVSAMASISSGSPTSFPAVARYSTEMGGSGNSNHFTSGSTREGDGMQNMKWKLREGKEWVVIGFSIKAAP